LCTRESALADELRALHARYGQWESLFGELGSQELLQKLREGLDTSARLTMSCTDANAAVPPSARPSSALLERLRGKAHTAGRYRLVGEIGRGGMGAVVKVWDEELGRPLAMKFVLGKGGPQEGGVTPPLDARTLTRFLDEASITSRLDHPGIVPVHEVGLSEDGQVYFTMRLVQGEDYARVIDHVRSAREGWTQTRALGVLVKVCDAMSYAHDHGVVHRDLKPANIMVGKYGETYVMDWGLARITASVAVRQDAPTPADKAPSASDDPLRTRAGEVLGTPSYMAPEQARGELERVGPRADIYSVGAMLYHLLACARVSAPFVPLGQSPLQNEVLRRLLAGPPPALDGLAGDAASELVSIAEKAMARDPERRYATMKELAADLQAYMEGRVVAAHERGAFAWVRKWVGRNKALAASMCLALAALVAGTLVSLSWARKAQDNEQAALHANGELRLRNRELGAQARELRLRGLHQDIERFHAEARAIGSGELLVQGAGAWWLERARDLVHGVDQPGAQWRPGLRDVEDFLAELRSDPGLSPYGEEERERDFESHPSRDMLAAIEEQLAAFESGASPATAALAADVLWRRRMLGRESWPTEEEALREDWAKQAAEDAASQEREALSILGMAGARRHGREMEALLRARRALESSSNAEREQRAATHALACAMSGRLDEARAMLAELAADAPSKPVEAQAGVLDRTRAHIDAWSGVELVERATELALDESRLERLLAADEARRAQLARGVEALRARCGERRTWRYASAQEQWRHDQLAQVRESLAALGQLLQAAEHSLEDPDAGARWDEALAAIARSPRYSQVQWPGGALTPQLGLVPLGENPATGLWEFLHHQSGPPPAPGPDGGATRDRQGNWTQANDTGIVFVLLPGGRMREEEGIKPKLSYLHHEFKLIDFAPFFLSIHETTQAQWDRLSERPLLHSAPHRPLHPASSLSWLDALALTRRMAGWVRLPSSAQWEYACRAGTTTPWWTGMEPASLRGAARVRFPGEPEPEPGDVGGLLVSPFGLFDMHGGKWEWCADAWLQSFESPRLVSRPRDGLQERDTASLRVIRGGASGYSPDEARSVFFTNLPFTHRTGDVGLRLAMPVVP
jgi:formylglycine-generating enzyme required for sulfatase activity